MLKLLNGKIARIEAIVAQLGLTFWRHCVLSDGTQRRA